MNVARHRGTARVTAFFAHVLEFDTIRHIVGASSPGGARRHGREHDTVSPSQSSGRLALKGKLESESELTDVIQMVLASRWTGALHVETSGGA